MNVIEKWHRQAQTQNMDALEAMLAEDAVFYSPVVHTPQRGRDQVMRYMRAANQVFSDTKFTYTRQIIGDNNAMLEFTAESDGIHINGVDIIAWNDNEQITEIRVMIRPLKAINKLWENMAAVLAVA